jgi:hypothetical protein
MRTGTLRIAIVATSLLAIYGLNPASGRTACTMKVYERADVSLGKAARNWSGLFQHWQQFRTCDDGAIGEGYSDAVVKLFANHWNQFSKFVALADRNPDFRRWTLRHIDASTSTDDLKTVVQNARRCMQGLTSRDLCRRLEVAARGVLEQK